MGITLKDIAQRVGKSVTTVSRALNDYDDVGVDTRTEIIRVAEEMGYSPNTLAQRLQKRQTDTIGFIIPTATTMRSTNPLFSEFLTSVGNKAADMGYDLLVSTQQEGEQELYAYRKMLEGHQVDGFVIARTWREDLRIQYLQNQNFPFVSFGKIEGDSRFPYVDVDGEYGMRLVAEMLLQNGHRRIACIAPNPEYAFGLCRLKGLRDYLADSGVQLIDAYIKYGDLDQRSGYEQAGLLLNLPEPPSAIAVCNDMMAFGAIRAAQEHDLVVGRDVCITGFDDVPMAEHSNPPLTTLHQPVEEIGCLVCEMLIKTIKGQALDPEQIILKPELIVRQSCGKIFH